KYIYTGFCDQACTTADLRSVSNPSTLYTTKQTKRDSAAGLWLWTESDVDGLGREVVSKSKGADGRGDHVISSIVDDQGRLARISIPHFTADGDPPNNLWTANQYDAMGRQTTEKAPSNAGTPIQTTVTYDDWKETVTDPKGYQKEFLYNGL